MTPRSRSVTDGSGLALNKGLSHAAEVRSETASIGMVLPGSRVIG